MIFDALKNLFVKQPEPVKRPPSSLFSTDVELFGTFDKSLDEVLSRPFLRTDKDFKPVNAAGKSTKVKGAMDNATPGNVGAFKPVTVGLNSIPFIQLEWYANQTFIGYQVAGIIAQHWLVDKACTMPGRDAMRHGYALTMNDGEKVEPKTLDAIKKLDKAFNLNKHCIEFTRMNRIFGIRIALFKVDNNDPAYYEKPFNPDGIKPGSYRGIVQVDPYWITPELDNASASDPSSLHFYEPTWWRINGIRYHRTHLVVIKNGEVVDILKPSYLYGGISVPQKIAERVFASERCANEAPMLAATKRTTVLHTDLTAAFANQGQFETKMQWWAALRDNYGVKAVGLDDVVEQFDISLADVDQVIMTQYQIVAAAAEVPATKLLGTSPKGFNATGEFEADSYHEFLESVQKHDIQPLLERHYLLLMKSEGLGLEIQIVWNPVDSPTGKELAEINLVKAQIGSALAASGAIDGVDERQRIIMDEDSGYSGIAEEVPEEPDSYFVDGKDPKDKKETKDQAFDEDDNSKGRWITIEGTHVKVDSKGNIVEGPPGLKEKLNKHKEEVKEGKHAPDDRSGKEKREEGLTENASLAQKNADEEINRQDDKDRAAHKKELEETKNKLKKMKEKYEGEGSGEKESNQDDFSVAKKRDMNKKIEAGESPFPQVKGETNQAEFIAVENSKPKDAILKLKDLYSGQEDVDTDTVKKYAKKSAEELNKDDDEGAPIVYKLGGRYVIAGGHHRAAAAFLRGETELKVQLHEKKK